jgi:hypothetical protein
LQGLQEKISKLEEEKSRLQKKVVAQASWIERGTPFPNHKVCVGADTVLLSATGLLATAEQAVQGVSATLSERDRLKRDLASVKDARVECEQLRARLAVAESRAADAASVWFSRFIELICL